LLALARIRVPRLSPIGKPQKSTAEGRKCGQLFSVEREGGRLGNGQAKTPPTPETVKSYKKIDGSAPVVI
jgi:hypothetical protein